MNKIDVCPQQILSFDAPNDITTRKRLLWDDAINRLSEYLV